MLYKRILLKLSGEMLGGDSGFGIDINIIHRLAGLVQTALQHNKQLAIVIGGGNFFRGKMLSKNGILKTTADQIGMLGTVMNALAIYDVLQQQHINTLVMSAYRVDNGICEIFNYQNATQFLNTGGVVIFCAGTGNPLFTTDSAAALRGVEIGADILIKATKVDGVYDKDPLTSDNAKKFATLSFTEAIAKKLKIMDISAFALCQENNLPVAVIKFANLEKIFTDKTTGTLIS